MPADPKTITVTIQGKEFELNAGQARDTFIWFIEQLVQESQCRSAFSSLLFLSDELAILRRLPPNRPQDARQRREEVETYNKAVQYHTDLVDFINEVAEELADFTEDTE